MTDPYLIINEIPIYERYLNRSIDEINKSMEFGMLQYLAAGRVCTMSEKQDVYDLFVKPDKVNMGWFTKKSYGYAKAGDPELKMFGQVKIMKISDLK